MVKIAVGRIEIMPKILDSNFTRISKEFSRIFSFFYKACPGLEIYFFIFQVFQGTWEL